MKKLISSFFILIFILPAVSAASFRKGSKLYVSAKSTNLKNGTGYFSKTISTLSYGDTVTVIESNSKKTKVTVFSDTAVTGWISNGSLTSKKITKSSGGVNASSNELALAGKGFSEQAEKAFRSTSNSLDYDEVDKIEKITVSENELEAFIKEGHLNGGEQ